ncbi:MAG: hypothetical protein ACFFEK_07100 [Candidatus Thorarchaeota archaeon]
MAKLERTTDAIDKGGWADMTDDANGVIEEYLELVNEHLPKSISEDVITELRTYMVEAAKDLGEGEITLQSAKKVVAQFGAPSEVAKEYKYSMLPETIPSQDDSTPARTHYLESIDGSVADETKDEKVKQRRIASYSSTIAQGLSIAVAWSFLVFLASTLAGPVWLVLDAYVILIIQVILAVSSFTAIVYYQKRQKKVLWKRDFLEWPLTQRFLTLPENAFFDFSGSFLVFDIIGSCIGIVIFFFSAIYSPSPYYIPIIVAPVSIAFLAKSYYSGRSIGPQDPVKHVRAEMSFTFIALVLIDSSQVWFVNFSVGSVFQFRTMIGFYSMVWGGILLLQLVARSGDLWWTTEDSKTAPARDERTILLHQTKNIAATTILKQVGWIVLFSVIPTYCLIISQYIYTPWFAPFWIAAFFGPIFIIPTALYFFFRRWLVHQGSSMSIIGQRSRIEAVADLLLLSYLLFGFVFGIQILIEPAYVLEQSHYLLDEFGFTGMTYFLTGHLSSILLLIIGAILRIMGDCLEFRENKRPAIQLMIISGMILVTSLSIRVGIDIMSRDYLWFSFMNYTVILLLATAIAFQVETSRVKLKIMNGTSSTSSHFMHTLDDTKLEPLNKVDSPEQKEKYLGN